MFSVAAMYDNGRGTPVNRLEAVRWYSMAAARGSGRAAYDLGVIYRDGDGVPRSKPLAIRYFRLAAAAGIEAARPNLARLGVAAGKPAATNAAPPAATVPANQQTDELSRFQAAAMQRSGSGSLRPAEIGPLIPNIDRAARNGDAVAAYELGFAYEHGVGVPSDPVKSYVQYLKAATSHDPKVNAVAVKGASEVGDHLTPEQHAAAREALLNGP